MAAPKRPIRFLYTGIRVRDLDRSIRFYKALGFRILHRGTMDHGGQWVHLTIPRSIVRLELNYYPEGNRFYTPWGPGSEFDHLGFYAEDADKALATARKAGGSEAIPAWDERTTRIGYVNDPDGVTLEFFGPRPKPRKAGAKKRRRSG